MAAVTGQAYMLEVLNAALTYVLTHTTAPLDTTCHLAVAPFAPKPTMKQTDFTEATFDGYAPVQVTSWGTAHVDQYGQYLISGTTPPSWFTPTGTTTPNTIVGYYLLDPGGNIVSAETLPNPVTLNGPHTTLQISPGIAIAPFRYTCTVAP
jgi:hypothetical protein